MNDSQRMTVERAAKILGRHYFDLGRGLWVDDEWGCCCADGLYILEMSDTSDDAEKTINLLTAKMPQGYTVKDMADAIAEHIGLPKSYVYGLNNGFEAHGTLGQIGDPNEDEDYRNGYQDGQELALFAGFEIATEPNGAGGFDGG